MTTPARTVNVQVDVHEALFEAGDESGHTLTMDMAGKIGKQGGRAFNARDLLLMALAGCSGGSFLNELRRRNKQLQSLSITVSGQLDTKPPAVFRYINLHLDVVGQDLDDDSMRAAALACHGNCSIHATLEHVAQIDVTYTVHEPAVAAGSR